MTKQTTRRLAALLLAALLCWLQLPAFAQQEEQSPPAAGQVAEAGPTPETGVDPEVELLADTAGGLQSLDVDGGYLMGTVSYSVHEIMLIVPWDGDGTVAITATGMAVAGYVSTLSFYHVQADGTLGEPIGGTNLPWTGGGTNRPVVRCDPFTVAQGAYQEVAIVVRGQGSASVTYKVKLYRTRARLELKTRVKEWADGSRQLLAELWGYDVTLGGLLMSLHYDPQVLQISDYETNQPQGSTVALGKAMDLTGPVGQAGDLKPYSKDLRFNQSQGIFRVAFASYGFGDDTVVAGSEGRYLTAFSFRIQEGAVLQKDSLQIDGADSGYDSNCTTPLAPAGHQLLLRETYFSGGIFYPDGLTITGLPGPLKMALPELFDLTGATVTAVDEETAEIVYPDGTVYVTWTNYEENWSTLPSTAQLQIRARPNEGYATLGWDKVGDRVYQTELAADYAKLKSVTPVFQANQAVDEAEGLTDLTVVTPAQRVLGRSDGGQGFQVDWLSYELVLLPEEPGAGLLITVPEGVTAEAALDPGTAVTLNTGENLFAPEQLADGDRLRITVGNRSYLIQIRRQEQPGAALAAWPQAGRDDLAQITLKLDRLYWEQGSLELTLPDGTWLTDEHGAALTFDPGGALSEEAFPALRMGNGLTLDSVRLEEVPGAGTCRLTIRAKGAGDGSLFSGETALVCYLHVPYQGWEDQLPIAPQVQATDQVLGAIEAVPVTWTDTAPRQVTVSLGSYDPKKPLSARYHRWKDDASGGWQEITDTLPQALPLWSGDGVDCQGNGQGTGFYIQTLRLPGLWAGRWQIELSKPGHVPMLLEVTVGETDVDGRERRLELPCGDLDGNGAVTVTDYGQLTSAGVLGSPGAEQDRLYAYDLDGDGWVDWSDAIILTSPGNLGRGALFIRLNAETDAT